MYEGRTSAEPGIVFGHEKYAHDLFIFIDTDWSVFIVWALSMFVIQSTNMNLICIYH